MQSGYNERHSAPIMPAVCASEYFPGIDSTRDEGIKFGLKIIQIVGNFIQLIYYHTFIEMYTYVNIIRIISDIRSSE